MERITNNGDGTMSACWTYSESYDIAAADRGTGYNYFDGSSWGTIPTSRIESEKTGWPNLGITGAGSETFICHNIAQGKLTMGDRGAVGSGSWSLQNFTAQDMVWNRMSVGGANGTTIHVIGLYDPFGNPWPPNGVQSQMLYYRSQNGGSSWDVIDGIIPGLDETNYSGFGGDAYHISRSKGDTVAVVYFGDLNDVILAKSTDNGDTWTTTKIIDVFPGSVMYDAGSASTTGNLIGISDLTGNGQPDTITSSDGAGWVMLDHNGMAHVFFGVMRYFDDTPADDTWSYFPATNGLAYWNESFEDRDPIVIAGSEDLDNNGTLDIIGVAAYFQSLSAYPTAGIADDGCIYMAYSVVMENLDQGSQNYRHIHVIKSCDNGCSWSNPVDFTPGTGFEENVYPSMAGFVDNNVNIVYMRDFEPGIAVNGDGDAWVLNEIVHTQIPVVDVSDSMVVCTGWVSGDSLFCPGDSVLITATCGKTFLWSPGGETTQSIWYKGAYGAVTCDISTECGTIVSGTINVAQPVGIPPIVTISSTTLEMCNGDSAWITATSNAGGAFLWSPGGATTSTIATDSAGTYTVSVSNCGGSTNESITITEPVGAPMYTVSATQLIMCSGDTSIISVSTVSQGVYIWSTGDTAQSITVTDTGTYTVMVSNCGGGDTTSITISIPSPPAAIVSGNDPFCDGDTITLMAGTEPSATYSWSNGDSTQSTMVDTVMSITLSVTNCGGTSNTTVSTSFVPVPTVNVNANPSTTFCDDGGSTTVTLTAFAFGSAPYTYMWSNTDTTQGIELSATAESGDYYVTVFNMCGDAVMSDTTTVTIHPPVSVATVSITDASSFGASDGGITTAVTGGAGPFSYSWSPSGIGPDPTGLASGTYSLTLTDSNGCTAMLSAFVDQPVGISELEFGSFNIHPNPNNGEFTVDLSNLGNAEYSIMVRNIIGQVVFSELVIGNTVNTLRIDLTDQEKGVYLITVSNSNGIRTEKLIVH
ncbi:MAG: hypothetical protein COB85_05100 [Bacteroidetes bacterium]|nr:MAG: hypothetical protein COB85_05100 [Bacteroidota bacterium]